MSYIYGFADSRKDMERELSSHTLEIIEHLLKIYLMPEHESAYHWKKEIASQIYCVGKLKNTKKFPTAKQIYEWTYYKKQDLVTDKRWFAKLVFGICEEYDIELLEDSNDFMYDFDDVCVSYFQWLASELSDVGLLTKPEIIAKITELIR